MPDTPDKRLPKQARHWVERAGFKLSFTRNWRDGIYASSTQSCYLAGCRDPKRHIRLLPHSGIVEICDGYFDRWANSGGAEMDVMPTTEAEFNDTLAVLVEAASKNLCKAA